MSGYDQDIFGAPVAAPAAPAGFDPSIFTPNPVQEAPKEEKKKGTGSVLLDSGNALGTGFQQALVRLAGLPVDTVANVLDLGKAAVGAPYMALTGKDAPSWLVPQDRKNIVGSGEYLLDKARQTAAGRLMVDAVNPDYQGGYIQGAGAALTGVVSPNSWQQAANQALVSVGGSAAGKLAYDSTGSTPLAIAAGMSPLLAQQYGTSAVQAAVRGGEKGRQVMEQRIQDLKNSGIENPTLGLASGNKVIGGVENLLQSTPGAIGVMGKAREAAISGLQNKAQTAAELASADRGALESGMSIQKGLNTDFRQQTKGTTTQLYDKLGKLIPAQMPVDVSRTRNTLSGLNEDIPGAPELSKQFKNERIQAIEKALLADSGMLPTGSATNITSPVFGKAERAPAPDLMNNPVYRGPLIGRSTSQPVSINSSGPMRPDLMGRMVPVSGSQQVARVVPGSDVPIYAQAPMRTNIMGQTVPVDPVIGERITTIQPTLKSAFSGLGVAPQITPTIPFEALKKTRTLVGGEIADNTLMSDVPRSKWNPLYGALSEDMRGAAAQVGPDATAAFNRANNYNRAAMERTERVAPFADAKTPEQAFRMYAKSAEDNLSTLQAVKKSLPEDARGAAAGTIIEKLGKATNGVQNDAGTAWSPETFLTNWNKMTPATRAEMFSGFKNSAQVKDAVDSVARATSMMRDTSKMWANPSGTSANLAARGVLGATVGAVPAAMSGLLSPAVPMAAGAGLLGTYGLARAVTSPKVVNAMASRNYMDPELLKAQFNSLVGGGLLDQR